MNSEFSEKPSDQSHLWRSTHKWKDARKAYQAALAANPLFKCVNPHIFAGDLTKDETFWADHQPYLLSRGYQLRPRYRPDWVPSWKDCKSPVHSLASFEDSIVASSSYKILDATRISDGCKVMMKRVDPRGAELHFARYLSSPHWADDTRNQTVPVLDIISLPDTQQEALLVMPQLVRFNLVSFGRFGEVLEALEQFLQGLDFMHAHKIAHRDACYLNLMMDASKLIPRGVHPVKKLSHDGVTVGLQCHDRWSVGPVKYYFIDFGLSSYYPDEPCEMETGLCGQDRTVPELLANEPYDPFKLDIFQLGNAFMEIIMNYDGLELLLPIIQAMTSANPKDRPSPSKASEMLASFDSETRGQRVSTHPTWEPWKRPNGSFEEDLAFLVARSQAAEKAANSRT